MLSDFVTSVIRTVVPSVVGSLLAWLVAAGIDLDPATTGTDVNPATAAALSTALVSICIGGYYAAARALESRWPSAGWLLGVPKQPSYGGTPAAVADVSTAPGDVIPEAIGGEQP